MQTGKKHPASRPLFVPVLTKPGGDRYVAFALYQVLQELQGPGSANGFGEGFTVAPAAIEGYDAQDRLKPVEAIDAEIAAIVAAQSLSHPHEAVAFYTGHELIGHLATSNVRKFAATHVHPEELLHELKGNDHDGKSWNHHSLRDEFGLDMLACPAHMATDIPEHVIDDPNVFWMFGVSAQRSADEVDLDGDPIFADAASKPVFVISMPTPSQDHDEDELMYDLLVRLVHHEEQLGVREIVLVDNPRSAHFKNELLDALGKEYKTVGEMGAFTSRVLPAIKRHPQSKIFLPGDSASVMTETVETLPWHQIIVQTAIVKDAEQRKLAPFFFDHGRVQIMDAQGRITKPDRPNQDALHAAYDVAKAVVARFAGRDPVRFSPAGYLIRQRA